MTVVAEKHPGAERLTAKRAFRQRLFQTWFGAVKFSVFLKTAIAHLTANCAVRQSFIQTALVAKRFAAGCQIRAIDLPFTDAAIYRGI